MRHWRREDGVERFRVRAALAVRLRRLMVCFVVGCEADYGEGDGLREAWEAWEAWFLDLMSMLAWRMRGEHAAS